MPHLHLHYSPNIPEAAQIATLFPAMHQIMVQYLAVKEAACVSWASPLQQYHLGDGTLPGAFVCIELKLKKGRAQEVRAEMGAALMEQCKVFFRTSLDTLALDLRLEVIELEETFFREHQA